MADTPVLDRLFAQTSLVATDWDEVYRAELPRVYSYFRYRVGRRETAEDLTSVTFEKAWRARDRYRRERSSIGTWLLSIAGNVAVDYFRARRVELPLEDLPPASLGPTQDEDLQRERDRCRLAVLIRELPARERELLALKYGAEETNRAIARVTGLSESNVGTILSRTVAALRSRFLAGGP